MAQASRRRLSDLPGIGRPARLLCERHELHAYRVDAPLRASLRRLMGLSGHRLLRGDEPLRGTGGLHVFRGQGARGGHSDYHGLGARSFLQGRPRLANVRREESLRVGQRAARGKQRLGHYEFRLWTHRSAELPDFQRALLDGGIPYRRPAHRRGGEYALSELRARRRRMAAEQIRRNRQP